MFIVTGGAGFIGSNIAAALCASDPGEVVICDVFGTSEKWRNVAKCEFADILTPGELREFIVANGRQIEAVLHMGAISATTETDVDAILANNFRLSLDLWRLCAEHRIRLLYASSAATYGGGEVGFDDDDSLEHLSRLRPLNAYGWSKHTFDRTVARMTLRGEPSPPQWAGLKFFNVYGPNEYHKGTMQSVVARSFPVAKSDSPVSLFKSHREGIVDGGQLRDFVYVKDCVAVVRWLLENPEVNGLFNVGTGKARSFSDLVRAMFHALGKDAAIQFVDMPEMLRDKYQYFTEAKMSRLRRAGFDLPMHTLEEGVRQYVQHYLATDDPYVGPESYRKWESKAA